VRVKGSTDVAARPAPPPLSAIAASRDLGYLCQVMTSFRRRPIQMYLVTRCGGQAWVCRV